MPQPVPTLGFPSRCAAIIALAKQYPYISNTEIAARTGSTPGNVNTVISTARVKRLIEPHGRLPVHLTLEARVIEGLIEPAARRGIPVSMLATHILRAVAQHDLTDAVLDDEQTAEIFDEDTA